MLNQASWKTTNVSLSVFFGMEHTTRMVFLMPVTFAWVHSLCFIKDILTQLFPWDLSVVLLAETWVQSYQEK